MEFSYIADFTFATWETWQDRVYFARLFRQERQSFEITAYFCNFRQEKWIVGLFLFKRLQRSEGILIIFELIPSKELVFRVERPRPPLGRTKDSRESRDLRCLFAKSFWNMDTRTVLRILFSLLCVKYIFFWCYGSFRFEGNNKYAGKVLRQPIGMRWPCNFPFRYVTDKILFTLQVYFDRSLPLKFSKYFSQF